MIPNPGEAPGKRSFSPVLAVGLAMLLVVVAMGGAWFLTRDNGDSDSSAPAATTAAPSTSAPSTTETTTADQRDLEAVVADLSSFVEDQRGLQFKEPVEVTLLDDDEFEQRLLDDFEEEDEADIRDTEDIFRALEFIGPDVDLLDQVKGALSAGVIGSYDPESNELLVRGTEPTPYAKQTIAHELTHALDDQHFELDRPELDDADDETGFAFSTLVEGDARTVENAYKDSLSQDEQDEIDQENDALAGDTDFSQFPPILLDLIGAPYSLGEPLIAAITADGGEEAVDAAFDDPPVSSEQIIDPSLFLSGEAPLTVAEPPADGDSFDQGTFGRFLLLELLDNGDVDREVARDAAIGWGGDQYVAWRDGDRTCIRVAFVGDTPTDTDEIETAVTAWAGTVDDAAVTRDADDQAVLTSCG